MILQILGCNAAFPWTHLEVTLDQPGRDSGNEPRKTSSRGTRKIANEFEYDFVEIDGTGDRPGTELMPITLTSRDGLRFDALTSDNLKVIRREVDRSAKSETKSTGEDARNSSQLSNSGGDEDSRQTDLGTRGSGIVEQETLEGAKPRHITPSDALRHTTNELLKLSNQPEVMVKPLLLTPHGIQYGPWQLNCVNQADGRPERWTKIHDSCPRGVLIAHVSCRTDHAYAIDIVRRLGESFSILVVQGQDNSVVQDSDLLTVLKRIDDARRLPKDADLTRDLSLSIHRVTHYHSSGPHSLSGVLNGLLSVLSYKSY
jgi:hypothetical protein